MNCFHLGGRAFHSRSLPLTQQGCAALNKTPAGERHTKKASLLQRSRHHHTSAFHSRTRPRPAHSSDASRAPTLTYALSHVFDSRATHARTLLPAALASVPFGFVLVRVRVPNVTIEVSGAGWDWDPHTFAEDPDEVTQNPFERLRDDNRVKAKREGLILKREGGWIRWN